MAKKKAKPAKSAPAAKSRKPAPAAKSSNKSGKAAKKKAPKPHAHDENCEHDDEEVELDATELEIVTMVVNSDTMRNALEDEVHNSMVQSVRKICKQHGKALNAIQAQNVARFLFSD